MKKMVFLSESVILPEELIEEILLRLSVKSLLRFKCVSKSWHSLISNPRFTKSHFDLTATPTLRLLMEFSKRSGVINSIDVEAPLEDNSFDAVFNLPNPSPKSGSRIDIVGSCRGFLLLKSDFSDFIYFVIWNPSTGFQKRFNIGFGKTIHYRILCGMGYDSSTDDIVVIVILTPPSRSGSLGMEVHCFSSNTDSWSCTESSDIPPFRYLADEHTYGSLLNGVLHWLVRSYDDRCFKIIAFDMIGRRLSEIPMLHDMAIKLKIQIYNLTIMGGCLCLWVPEPAEMWMMKEYKVQSSWTNIFFNYHRPFSNGYFYPICFTKNDELLGYDDYQMLFRLHNKANCMTKPHKSDLRRFSVRRFGILHRCCLYSESLLSLPGNFEE